MILTVTSPASMPTYLVNQGETRTITVVVSTDIDPTTFKWYLNDVETRVQVGFPTDSYTATLEVGVHVIRIEGYTGGNLEAITNFYVIISDNPEAVITGQTIYQNSPANIQLYGNTSHLGLQADGYEKHLFAKSYSKKGYLQYYMQQYPVLKTGIIILADALNNYTGVTGPTKCQTNLGITPDHIISAGNDSLRQAIFYAASNTSYTKNGSRSTIVLATGNAAYNWVNGYTDILDIGKLTIIGEVREIIPGEIYCNSGLITKRVADNNNYWENGLESKLYTHCANMSAFNFKNFENINICQIDFAGMATYGEGNNDPYYSVNSFSTVKIRFDNNCPTLNATLNVDSCYVYGWDFWRAGDQWINSYLGGSIVVDNEGNNQNFKVSVKNCYGLIGRSGLVKIYNHDKGYTNVEVTNGMFYFNDDPISSQRIVKFCAVPANRNQGTMVTTASPADPTKYNVSIRSSNLFFKVDRWFDKVSGKMRRITSTTKAGDLINLSGLFSPAWNNSTKKWAFFYHPYAGSLIPTYFRNNDCLIVIPSSYNWGPTNWKGPLGIIVDCSTVDDNGNADNPGTLDAIVKDIGVYGTEMPPANVEFNGIASQVYFTYDKTNPNQLNALRNRITNFTPIVNQIATDDDFRTFITNNNWILELPGIQWLSSVVGFSHTGNEWYTTYYWNNGYNVGGSSSVNPITDLRLMPYSPLVGQGEGNRNIGFVPFQTPETKFNWSRRDISTYPYSSVLESIGNTLNLNTNLTAGTWEINFDITKYVPSPTGLLTQSDSDNTILYVAQAPLPVILPSDTYYIIENTESFKSLTFDSSTSDPIVGSITQRKWYVNDVEVGTSVQMSHDCIVGNTKITLEITNSLDISMSTDLYILVQKKPKAIIVIDTPIICSPGEVSVDVTLDASSSQTLGLTDYHWENITTSQDYGTSNSAIKIQNIAVGTFNIKLTVLDETGYSDFITIQIEIIPGITCNAGIDEYIVVDYDQQSGLVTFDGSDSSYVDKYEWKINDIVVSNSVTFTKQLDLGIHTAVLKVWKAQFPAFTVTDEVKKLVINKTNPIITSPTFIEDIDGYGVYVDSITGNKSKKGYIPGNPTTSYTWMLNGKSWFSGINPIKVYPMGRYYLELTVTKESLTFDVPYSVSNSAQFLLTVMPKPIASISHNAIIPAQEVSWNTGKFALELIGDNIAPSSSFDGYPYAEYPLLDYYLGDRIDTYKWYNHTVKNENLLGTGKTINIDLPVGMYNIILVLETDYELNDSKMSEIKIIYETITAPIANALATNTHYVINNNEVTVAVTLDGSLSSDPFTGQELIKYEWYLGDILVGTDKIVEKHLGVGLYPIMLKVYSLTGYSHECLINIECVKEYEYPYVEDVTIGETTDPRNKLEETQIMGKGTYLGYNNLRLIEI